MQETGELREIADDGFVPPGERVIEGDVYRAITVFHIKNYSISSDFAPAADDFQPAVTSRHYSGQIDGANFKIFRNSDCFFDHRSIQNARNDQLLSGFEEGPLEFTVGFADRLGELAAGEVRRLGNILMGNGDNAVAALGGINSASRRSHERAWSRQVGR